MTYTFKPDVKVKILKNNNLRLALMALWNVRERSMERAIINNSVKCFTELPLSLIEEHLKLERKDIYSINQ